MLVRRRTWWLCYWWTTTGPAFAAAPVFFYRLMDGLVARQTNKPTNPQTHKTATEQTSRQTDNAFPSWHCCSCRIVIAFTVCCLLLSLLRDQICRRAINSASNKSHKRAQSLLLLLRLLPSLPQLLVRSCCCCCSNYRWLC